MTVRSTPRQLPLRRRILFRCGAVGLSVFTLAFVLELGARVLVPDSSFRVLANVFARDDDPRIRYTMKRGYVGSAFGVELVTNSFGFRGADWATTNDEGALRIALIGDSHAFGFGVKFEQTMGEQLTKRLQAKLGRPVEVLNFGVNGYNTRQEAAVLEAKALPLAPDVVLLLPCNNDADAPMWVDAEGFLRTGEDGNLQGTRNIGGFDRHQRTFAAFQRRAISASRFLMWLRVHWLHYSMSRAAQRLEIAEGITADKGWMPPAGNGPVDEALRGPVYDPLASMVDLCRARGIGVGILWFGGTMNWRRTLNAFAADKQVPLLDLLSSLEGVDSWEDLLRKWSLGWDSHMAAPAQEVWASKVAEFLLARGLIK